jgi:hypothetical protein
MGLAGQALVSRLAKAGVPPPDGPEVDAEEAGDRRLGIALLEPLHGQPSPPFELLGRTSCSHAELYA